MDFQIPKIVHEDADDHRGVFAIEPLDRGFGHTFGNSLRRVLLSSLKGDLTVSGSTRPVTLDVTVQEAAGETRLTGRTKLSHSDFGIKPYSKMGVLKIKDEVDVEVSVALPSA